MRHAIDPSGYPLPLLAHSVRGQPFFLVYRANLIKDWAQWALASWSVLYLIWWLRVPPRELVRPEDRAAVRRPGPGSVGGLLERP